MKKIISQILLLSLLTVIFSCNNYGTYIMPTFRPLDNTADIIFIENTRWLAQETEIIAINTKTSKAEQIYRFNARFFKNFVRTTDNNICYFSFYSYIVGLNTLTGKCFEIYNEPIWDNNIHNENLYFTNDYDHTQTFCYNPNTNQLEETKTYGAISSEFIERGDSLYCVNFIGYLDHNAETETTYTIYNFTKKSTVSLEYGYQPFEMFCNKYLVSFHTTKGGVYLHEVISFEPENIKLISQLIVVPDSIANDDEYIYIGGHNGNVCVIRKSDNEIIAESESLPEFEGGGLTIIKNGYAWTGADQGSGDFYRIETVDNDGDGVLQWKLFKN